MVEQKNSLLIRADAINSCNEDDSVNFGDISSSDLGQAVENSYFTSSSRDTFLEELKSKRNDEDSDEELKIEEEIPLVEEVLDDALDFERA